MDKLSKSEAYTKEAEDLMAKIVEHHIRKDLAKHFKVWSREDVETLFSDLFQSIKHGDQEHQDWLENKIKEFLIENL